MPAAGNLHCRYFFPPSWEVEAKRVMEYEIRRRKEFLDLMEEGLRREYEIKVALENYADQ